VSRKTKPPAIVGAGGLPEPGKGRFTYPMALMLALIFGYIAYLLHIGFTPHDALVFAICSTAVLGGVSYLPNALIKLMRALGQQ
jgi:hypothetical protein